MSKKTLNSMVHDIHELGRKYRELSYKEERILREKDLVDVRWLFAFLPYQTNWKLNENK